MHLFVTLLINKTTGSDNQHFFFNTLKNENKEEFLTYGKLTNATVIGLSETKLNNTVLSSELKTEGYDLVRSYRSRRGGGVACFVKNSISYNWKPNFCINAESIFIEIFLPKSKPVLIGILCRPPDKYDVLNWNIFQTRGMHLIHLNINSILPNIDKIRYIAKLTNATVIGLSETKLDNAVLSSELEIEGYDLVRSDRSRRGGGVACFVKTLLHIIENLIFALIQRVFL